MRRLEQQFPDELVVIGVHSAKFPSEKLTENIRQAVLRFGIDHPVVNDAGFKTWNAYAVNAWPTLVLIDPTGRIVGETSGEILAEDFAQQIIEVINQFSDRIDRAPLDLQSKVQLEPERPLRYPARLLVVEDSLLIADSGHHRLLQIKLDEDGGAGELERVFGSGSAGLQDGPAEEAQFNHPHGMGLVGTLEKGTLYVADTENHAIRAIDLPTGQVRTVAGTGQKAHGRLTLGQPTEVPLRSPWAVLPLDQYLFIAMAGSHQIWVLINNQQIGPFAGTGQEALVDGPVAESAFNQPSDLSFGQGYLFVADPEASAVRAISLGASPETVTLVGQGLFDFGDIDGATTEALLQHPAGLVFHENKVYVADTYNNKVKLLDPAAGQTETLIGTGQPGMKDGSFAEVQLFEPEGVQAHQQLLYIADTNNHQIRVADLEQRQVYTFTLRGLDRLPRINSVDQAPQTLPSVEVSPGQVRLVIDVQLPEGYKRNADIPTQLRIGEESTSKDLSFTADQEIAWNS